jgi:hypothetical protein
MKAVFSRRSVGAICAAAASFVVAGAANAATFNTTMNTLVDNGANAGGITLGDKRYSNFTFSSTGDAPVAASAVDVSLVSTDNDNHYQLRFTFSRDPLDSTAGQTSDVVIGYRIDVLGQQLINRVGLAFASTVGGTTAGDAATVIETIRRPDGQDVSPAFPGQDQILLTVANDGTGGLPDNDSSSLLVTPTGSLVFQKDILVSSRPNGGAVTISTVDNFVDQVPEPASTALLALAGGVLLARRRRA